jgi:hypothetical protein
MPEYGYCPKLIKQQIKEELEKQGIRDENILEERATIILHNMENLGMMSHWEGLRDSFGSRYATRQILKKLPC